MNKRKFFHIVQGWLEADKLVCLDESGVNTDMTRLYGRSIGKKRVEDHVPFNKGKRTTIISSVRLDGTTVPVTITGAMNGEIFKNYITDTLIPTLHKGDFVVMDNLPAHKVKGVKEAIEKAECYVLHTPPYSPEFNPIEEMWSKLKAYLRKIKERNADTLINAITNGFKTITNQDCAGWFTHAGYLIQ